MEYEDFESIGNLIEKRSQEKLSSIINRIKRFWLGSPIPYFFPGYIASDTETFDRVMEYIRQEFEISEDSVYELIIPENAANYLDLFINRKHEFSQNAGSILIIKAKGFAKTKKLILNPGRTAHDFDQDLERFLPGVFEAYGFTGENRYKWEIEKRIIIASYIDVEDDLYETALNSAGASDFKYFLWEFKKES